MLNRNELGQAIDAAIKAKIASGAIKTKADVARYFGVKDPSISDWIKNGTISKDKLPKLFAYFADVVAPEHWGLSTSEAGFFSSIEPSAMPARIRFEESFAVIPRLSAKGSMGAGELVYEGDQIIDMMPLAKDWVRRNINAPPEALRVITGAGDSMEPTFKSGDLLLVDTSKKSVDVDGVYVLSAHNKLFIKRVRQRMSGEFEISSDNPTVKTVDVLDGRSPVSVHGRVVWAWNGKSL